MKALVFAVVFPLFALSTQLQVSSMERVEALLDETAFEIEASGQLPPSGQLDVVDPWGIRLQYYRVGHAGFFLVSLGADRSPGGQGVGADFVIYRALSDNVVPGAE